MTTSRRRVPIALGLALGMLGVVACAGGSGPAASHSRRPVPTVVPTPGAAWTKVAPAAVGLDAAKLDAIAAQADAGKSSCFVVTRDGKLAGEWYFHGGAADTPREVFSATKSYTSTLVGIAQDDGDLHLGDSASKWIAAWRGTPSQAVTVRDLLSNDSGRRWSLDLDYRQLLQARDKTGFAVGLDQEHPPGQSWAYNNSAIQTLSEVLGKATGENVVTFAHDRIFAPLGMDHTRMTTDATGHALTFMGLQSTCLDMARFGNLMLNRGVWGHRRIVSPSWVAAATGEPSTVLNAAYGYLWWMNHEGVVAGPLAATSLAAAANPTTKRGRLVPGAPDDMYWALGLGNQVIQVDPATKTVVVRLGRSSAAPGAPNFDEAATAKVVTDAVLR